MFNRRIETKEGQTSFKTLDLKLEVKELSDEGFSGYASVFGVEDQGEDVVVKGAFTQTLADIAATGKTIPMLFGHDPHSPIGKYDQLREDDKGLWCHGLFTKGVARAAETHALMKDGVVDGLSIGFRTKRYEIDRTNPDKFLRKLLEVQLFEISVVTFPMLDIARATDVKTMELEPRELEQLLKSSGFSKADAVKAVGIVKKHLQRDVEGTQAMQRDTALSGLLETIRESRKVLRA